MIEDSDKELLHYQMTGINSEGKYFIYYSINDTVIDPDECYPSNNPNTIYF